MGNLKLELLSMFFSFAGVNNMFGWAAARTPSLAPSLASSPWPGRGRLPAAGANSPQLNPACWAELILNIGLRKMPTDGAWHRGRSNKENLQYVTEYWINLPLNVLDAISSKLGTIWNVFDGPQVVISWLSDISFKWEVYPIPRWILQISNLSLSKCDRPKLIYALQTHTWGTYFQRSIRSTLALRSRRLESTENAHFSLGSNEDPNSWFI